MMLRGAWELQLVADECTKRLSDLGRGQSKAAQIAIDGVSRLVERLSPAMDADHADAMAAELADELRKAKRRVPPEKRKRAAHSCDRCKSKRIKCQQDGRESEPSEAHPCSACKRAGIACSVTIERKTRTYGAAFDDVRSKLAKSVSTPPAQSQPVMQSLPQKYHDYAPAFHSTPTYHPMASTSGQTSSSNTRHTSLDADDFYGQAGTSQTYEEVTAPQSDASEYADPVLSGPSACLSLAAELQTLIAKYDKNAPFVHETLSHTFGSDEVAVALLRDDVSWTNDPVFISEMLDTFFNNIHPFYPVLHRSTYLRTIAANSYSHLSDSDRLGVCAIVAIAASWKTSRTDHPAYYEQRRKEAAALASSLSGRVFTTSTFNSFQSLLLWAYYLQHHCQREGSWNVMGVCIRIAYALNLHRESCALDINETAAETRKLVFWTMYQSERFLNGSLGRFGNLIDAEVTCPYPLEHVVDLTSIFPRGVIPNYSEVYKILGRIGAMYTAGQSPTLAEVMEHAESMAALKAALPQHLTPSSRMLPRHRQNITMMRCLLLSVTQYITRGTLRALVSQIGRSPILTLEDKQASIALGRTCVQAAIDCAALLDDLRQNDLLDDVAPQASYWAYLAALVLAVPLAAEIGLRERSNTLTQFTLLIELGISRTDVVTALRSIHDIALDQRHLTPTFRHFASVTASICKAVRITAERPEQSPSPPDLPYQQESHQPTLIQQNHLSMNCYPIHQSYIQNPQPVPYNAHQSVFSFDPAYYHFNSSLEIPTVTFAPDTMPQQDLTAWLYGAPTEWHQTP